MGTRRQHGDMLIAGPMAMCVGLSIVGGIFGRWLTKRMKQRANELPPAQLRK